MCSSISFVSCWSAPSPRKSDCRRRTSRSRSRRIACSLSLLPVLSLRVADHDADGGRETVPALELARELFAARRRQGVELGFTAGFGHARLCLQPALLLEPMQ